MFNDDDVYLVGCNGISRKLEDFHTGANCYICSFNSLVTISFKFEWKFQKLQLIKGSVSLSFSGRFSVM